MRTISFLLLAVALGAPISAAASDPYADVSAMRLAFVHVRSVVAIERFQTGDVATIEYASPNRYHITMPSSQMILTGNVEYSKRVGGVWKRSPNGAEHQALLSEVWELAGPPSIDIHKLFTITSLGAKTIDREPVRGYQLHDIAGAYDEILWINPNDLPVVAIIEMPEQTVKIHYVDYNASVLIAMP
jgi:hypothetical protein